MVVSRTLLRFHLESDKITQQCVLPAQLITVHSFRNYLHYKTFPMFQTLEELRPLMRTGIPKLGLPPTEPMNIESMQFSQGSPPVVVQASFENVVGKGLSNFVTDFIEVDPITRYVSA